MRIHEQELCLLRMRHYEVACGRGQRITLYLAREPWWETLIMIHDKILLSWGEMESHICLLIRLMVDSQECKLVIDDTDIIEV